MDLQERECVPCRAGTPPLDKDQSARLLGQLDGWQLDEQGHLTKTYRFPDFKQALALVDRIGALAEAQNHHPDLALSWGKVRVELWTHKINGLSENDFIFAAHCDQLVTP